MEPCEIERVIRTSVETAYLRVLSPRLDGAHFEAIVVSPDFIGKSLVEQHQMVMHALKDHFELALHALSLKTFTPQQWEKKCHG